VTKALEELKGIVSVKYDVEKDEFAVNYARKTVTTKKMFETITALNSAYRPEIVAD